MDYNLKIITYNVGLLCYSISGIKLYENPKYNDFRFSCLTKSIIKKM